MVLANSQQQEVPFVSLRTRSGALAPITVQLEGYHAQQLFLSQEDLRLTLGFASVSSKDLLGDVQAMVTRTMRDISIAYAQHQFVEPFFERLVLCRLLIEKLQGKNYSLLYLASTNLSTQNGKYPSTNVRFQKDFESFCQRHNVIFY